jgi:hypothetical protein
MKVKRSIILSKMGMYGIIKVEKNGVVLLLSQNGSTEKVMNSNGTLHLSPSRLSMRAL